MNNEPQPALDFNDVLASAVHDIKNSISLLLTSIDSVSEVISADSPAYRAATGMQFEARKINYELLHLLGLFKLERSADFLRPEYTDAEEILEELHAYNAELMERRNIELSVECNAMADVYCDRELILSVLNATVNNALKYARAQVCIRFDAIDSYKVFSVADDGPGYPEEMLAKDTFSPGETQHNSKSTGLGFYFAERIAAMHRYEEHSGSIALSNDGLDGGGLFCLRLP